MIQLHIEEIWRSLGSARTTAYCVRQSSCDRTVAVAESLQEQGDYKVKVTFNSRIYLMPKEVWPPTLYCTNVQLNQFELNVIGVLYGHLILE